MNTPDLTTVAVRLEKLMRHNSITSLAKLTHTRIEYGFQWVYFDGSTQPTEYRRGKEFLAKRAIAQGYKEPAE